METEIIVDMSREQRVLEAILRRESQRGRNAQFLRTMRVILSPVHIGRWDQYMETIESLAAIVNYVMKRTYGLY